MLAPVFFLLAAVGGSPVPAGRHGSSRATRTCQAGSEASCYPNPPTLPRWLAQAPPGAALCPTLRRHCEQASSSSASSRRDPRRAAAVCVKHALQAFLPDSRQVTEARRRGHFGQSLEPYLLCSGRDVTRLAELSSEDSSSSPRARALTALLADAVQGGGRQQRSGGVEERVDAQESELALAYRRSARISTLERQQWTFGEKVAHFTQALVEVLPDNLHLIDRLAVLLQGPLPSARALLLHYAVLRGIVAHPLQRPMRLVRGLAARPWWDTQQELLQGERGGEGQHGGGGLALLASWRRRLEAPESIAAMTAELEQFLALSPGDSGGGRRENATHHVAEKQSPPLLELQDEGIHRGGMWTETHLVLEEEAVDSTETVQAFPRTLAILLGPQKGGASNAWNDDDDDHERENGAEIGMPPPINARFSAIDAGTHITPHCGMTNAKLRIHLPLIMPPPPPPPPSAPSRAPSSRGGGNKGGGDGGDSGAVGGLKSGLRVGQHTRLWQLGQALIFDDSFEHEVWWLFPGGQAATTGKQQEHQPDGDDGDDGDDGGRSDASASTDLSKRRVVLIVDVFHPGLGPGQQEKMRATFARRRGGKERRREG